MKKALSFICSLSPIISFFVFPLFVGEFESGSAFRFAVKFGMLWSIPISALALAGLAFFSEQMSGNARKFYSVIFGGIAIIVYLLTLNEIIDQAVQNGLKFSGSVFSHTGKGFWMIVVGFLSAILIPLPEKPRKF
jgi:uncharacterized membrane protein (GlpM family)